MKHHNTLITASILIILVVGGIYLISAIQSPPAAAQGSDSVPQSAQSPTNTLFSYQGQLLDMAGNPINNPSMPMTFKLYSAAAGGSACWTENQTVNVQDGRFHTNLGAVAPIPDTCLGSDAYLELAINGETLTPRELLTSVAHAVEASTVPNGAITSNKLRIDAPVNMFNHPIQYGLIWPPSYDGRGSRTALPGFFDTLYYATERGITVTANPNPSGGASSLANMFNLNPSSYARWNGVSSTNPVEITIAYPSRVLLSGVVLSFGDRNSQAIDYTVEYYQDQDNNGVYEWLTIADITGNTDYETYHSQSTWRVQKIRITVTKAGDGDHNQQLIIATIQAPSSKYGKSTGPMLDVGGDSMYGMLDMTNNNISNVENIFGHGGASSGAELHMPGGNNEGNLYLNWHSGGKLAYGGGTETTKFSVDPAGNGYFAGSLTCGGYIETNLQTPEEQASTRIDRFTKGDLMCWEPESNRLEPCSQPNSPLVMAVADPNGKPIILGAEPVKVIGPVEEGDYLVSSTVPGYAVASKNPKFGIVIAQALEDFDGEQGIILAMIRKM